jgi:diguanylate cyclase (GGDEF)-like protein
MDATTLRIALSAITAVLLLLFYVGVYRPTRARFSGCWTLSLLFFAVGSVCYLANGTTLQVILNPLGNGFALVGAEAAWAGARSLRSKPVRRRWLLPFPVISVAAGLLGDPAHDTWSGGLTFLVLMTATFAATSGELVRARHPMLTDNDPAHTEPLQLITTAFLLRVLSIASGALAAFYAARIAVYVATGPTSHLFETWFGTGPTSLLLALQLVAVSFSMSALSTQQQLDELRHRAVYDQLTGLTRPLEFRTQAEAALRSPADPSQITALAMVDLDHFKWINDELGHAAGDDVLRAFGQAARLTLGSQRAVCGRMGGEEFALLFGARDMEHAEELLTTLCRDFPAGVRLADGREPTASVGLVQASPHESLRDLLERADRALYRAKAEGRSRVVRA